MKDGQGRRTLHTKLASLLPERKKHTSPSPTTCMRWIIVETWEDRMQCIHPKVSNLFFLSLILPQISKGRLQTSSHQTHVEKKSSIRPSQPHWNCLLLWSIHLIKHSCHFAFLTILRSSYPLIELLWFPSSLTPSWLAQLVRCVMDLSESFFKEVSSLCSGFQGTTERYSFWRLLSLK